MSGSRRDFLKGLLALPIAAAAIALVPKKTHATGWDKAGDLGDFSVGQRVTIGDDGYVTSVDWDPPFWDPPLEVRPMRGIVCGPSVLDLDHVRAEIVRALAVPSRLLKS